MFICIAATQTTSTETQSSAREPIDTETTADRSSSSVQIEQNIDECASGIDTEDSQPIAPNIVEMSTDDEDWPEFDLGKWVGNSSKLSDTQKSQILKHRWVPPESYNFRADSNDPARCFIHKWLTDYEPWLTYSKKLKGGLCLYCVLFSPITVHGVFGALIVTPFTKYKDLHDSCKSHAKSQWHRTSTISAKSFMDVVPVNIQMISGHEKLIENNKKILSNIISTIIFCGTHDMALRGKQHNTGNFS